ncbi:ATP-dependent helicase [Thermoleophilum album]|uniref:DNA 3'-5' helicase n=1 Tax=Thermoleophilum album TaxID=29539 RepID=A0A1H6FSS0_THEAL|nr:ATP-dependent DNA helicase [Thermoleophilum album]SEH13887.1 DNA helicase-2 / ATP-dependent DNA helicase PcrA [Thermoleophilum album]
MTIAPVILKHYPRLNDVQREIVGHLDGPLLVIAGPGSGKTHSIVLRALNLLLLEKAQPRQIVLCTFTEKAALEMRDRLAAAARTVGYEGDLSELTVSTIHGLCNHILTQHRHRTDLGHNYETLDELTQLLFIFEHFDEIVGPAENGLFLGRWRTRWTAIEGARAYFDKITEELIEPERLRDATAPFIRAIGEAYLRYERALVEANRTDFAHLQRFVYDLLRDPATADAVTCDLRYILVDEYQDTNYIQEQLLLKLTEKSRNLCVVGDEDQSLYRFRGATVRNILEFPQRVPDARVLKLTTNYRSHRAIVERYDRWMASCDWSNPNGPWFRYDKTIRADTYTCHPEYPAVISIWGRDRRDEATRFADLVAFLKSGGVITDYSQVALLLHSVREEHSGPYLAALEAKGIPAFCPRARAYFGIPAVRDLVACFAVILGWHGDGRGQVAGAVADLARYVDDAIVALARRFAAPHPLAEALRRWAEEIAGLREGETLDLRLADYLYRLLALEPFRSAVRNENTARTLAIFSQLLNVFQTYYHYTVITHRNREALRLHFFNSFLRLLYDGGINEYEDPDQPLPKGHVQVMTIHQAKGLEFPVVVVGSLSNQLSSPKQVDRDLGPFYHRPPFEPASRITLFDRMRLHYVAFSRPQKLLVLTAHEKPKDHFAPIWEGLPQWPYVQKELLAAQRFEARERMPVKKSYSFTGDLKIYETCPRQYQFFREYDFTPSRSAVIFFGLLVHQAIEEIHRIALDGRLDTLDEHRIRELFDRTFRFLALTDVRPIGDAARAAAFEQVMNYFRQNQDVMRRVVQTEVDVSLEKEGYILQGKVDLLLGGDGKLELLDFKTSPRPKDSPELIAAYERQLCTYAHILERRHGRRVDRLLLYWTSEPRKEDALMVLPYDPARVEEAGRHFDEVVRRIQAREFAVTTPPEAAICQECDLRMLCRSENIIIGSD